MTCTTCSSVLELGAVYCGVCGERVRSSRDSLAGMLLDGRFRIEAKLAAGGFGAIYRATQIDTGALVAIKVLHADLACDPNLSARFRREAAALAQLRDPHTVTTYELAEAADGTLFIVMELLHGTSLLARFRSQGPLGWRRVVSIARDVCSSLAEAHALGIVHRDLKPANIHLEHRGGNPDFVKVLDFGIAKLLHGSDLDDGDELTRVGQAIGTLDYMSPEQIVGGDCDARSDIYTLGTVMYEMIAGRRPFADASGPTSLLTALMTQAPVPLAGLFHADCMPAELDRVLMRCLEREPDRRFADAGELAAALDRILARPERARVPVPMTTLPGSGPHAFFVGPDGPDGDDVTSVDPLPPQVFEPAWESTMVAGSLSDAPLARTPHLAAPPSIEMFEDFAVGSTVGPTPAGIQTQAAERGGALRIAGWVTGLLAGGIGLGIAVASLI